MGLPSHARARSISLGELGAQREPLPMAGHPHTASRKQLCSSYLQSEPPLAPPGYMNLNNTSRNTHSDDVNEARCEATRLQHDCWLSNKSRCDIVIPLEHIALHLTYLWLILELLLYPGSRKSNICKVRTNEINGMYSNISNSNPILSS